MILTIVISKKWSPKLYNTINMDVMNGCVNFQQFIHWHCWISEKNTQTLVQTCTVHVPQALATVSNITTYFAINIRSSLLIMSYTCSVTYYASNKPIVSPSTRERRTKLIRDTLFKSDNYCYHDMESLVLLFNQASQFE